MQGVTLVDHPLVQHKLTLMRDKTTSTAGFRQLLREIALLLTYEVTRDLKLTTKRIETPLAPMDAPILEGKKPVFASILRAGNGLLEGMLDLVPSARVAHVGIYRNPDTLEAIEYYFKAPEDLADRLVIVVDPMLATASGSGSSVHPPRTTTRIPGVTIHSVARNSEEVYASSTCASPRRRSRRRSRPCGRPCSRARSWC